MRIIITNEGAKEISSISKNSSMKSLTSKYNPLYNNENRSKELSKSNSTSIIFSGQIFPKIKNSKSLSKEKNIKSKYISSFNLSQINPLFIKIKQSKLQIPQEQTDLYDSDKYNLSFIVKQSNNIFSNLSNRNDLTNNSLSFPLKQTYNLGEIINEKCFDKLNKRIKKDQFINQHDKIINEKDLRKKDESYKVFEEIEKGKKTKIDINHSSLIEYLINKKTISETLLNNLSHYNQDRMTRLNKICQRVIVGQEKEKMFEKKSKEKIQLNKRREEEDFKNNLDFMKNSIEEEMKTFNKFNFKLLKNNKERYSAIFNQFKKKYWMKNNNFQRYFRSKNSFKKEDINNSFYYNDISSFYPNHKRTTSVELSKPTEKNILTKY